MVSPGKFIKALSLLLVIGTSLSAAPQIGESTSNLSRKQLSKIQSDLVEQIRAGKQWKAEQDIIGQCKEVSTKYGEDSHEHAQMLFIQAVTYGAMRNMKAATAALSRASDIPGKTHQAKKDRLTYLMNLGDFLILTDERDEAEKVLRTSLKQREEFYGKDHSGYAFGQEALAKVLIAKGMFDEAVTLCEGAIKIESKNGNPHFAEDVSTMAYALAGVKPDSNLWPLFEKLSPELRTRAINYSQVLIHEMDPKFSLKVFQSLSSNLNKFSSSRPNDKVDVLVSVANTAFESGEPAIRISAFEEVLKLLPPTSPSITDIHLALSVAHENNDQPELVEPSYESAVKHAEKIDDQNKLAESLREFGIWLGNEKMDANQADMIHKRSVTVASKLDDLTHGHALCAYGVFLQHGSKHEPAAKLLKKAIDLLPEGHPYLFTARNHLPYAQRGEKCKCGESAEQVTLEMINEMMARRLPEDLFDEVILGQSGVFEVKTKRKPTDEEAKLIRRALENAKLKMRGDR